MAGMFFYDTDVRDAGQSVCASMWVRWLQQASRFKRCSRDGCRLFRRTSFNGWQAFSSSVPFQMRSHRIFDNYVPDTVFSGDASTVQDTNS
jgi:hypothetical protein